MTDKDTIIASQEAEILRLQGALDDVERACLHIKDGFIREHCEEYDKGWRD